MITPEDIQDEITGWREANLRVVEVHGSFEVVARIVHDRSATCYGVRLVGGGLLARGMGFNQARTLAQDLDQQKKLTIEATETEERQASRRVRH